MTAPTVAPGGPFALQKKSATPKNVVELLSGETLKAEIAKVLPRHITPERMLRTALTTVKMNDKLQKVPIHSFASAMMKCSQYGLEPDGRHAHLIPFKTGKKDKEGQDIYDLNLIFDYKGLVALVRRSGEVQDIHCDVVYESDEFECSYGEGGRLFHKPNLKVSKKDRGPIICAYSFVKMKDGGVSYEAMPICEIEEVRDNSQGYRAYKSGFTKSSPWETNFAEMAKKTAFRRHSKWLTLSPELRDAVNADDDEDARFERAKPIAAAVVPADFSAPALPEGEPSSPVQSSPVGGSQAGQGSVVPEPASPESYSTPEMDPEQPTPPPQPNTQEPVPTTPVPVPNETLGKPEKPKEVTPRQHALSKLKSYIKEAGMQDADFIAAATQAGHLPPNVQNLSALTTEHMNLLSRDFDAILQHHQVS